MKKKSLEEEIARTKVNEILANKQGGFQIFEDLEVLAGMCDRNRKHSRIWDPEFRETKLYKEGINPKELRKQLSNIIDMEIQKSKGLFDTMKLGYALYALDKPIVIRKDTENESNIWIVKRWIKERFFWLLEPDNKSPM